MRKPIPRCDNCGGNWLENPSPMVHDHIWAAIGLKPNQLLCYGCLHDQLYRDCPFTDAVFAEREEMSMRLTVGRIREKAKRDKARSALT